MSSGPICLEGRTWRTFDVARLVQAMFLLLALESEHVVEKKPTFFFFFFFAHQVNSLISEILL